MQQEINKKLIFLDVDGTLIDYKAQTPPSAKEAIDIARKNGHKVFICTGCSKFEIEKRDIPEIDGMVLANGGYVETDNKILLHKSLTIDDEKKIVDWCQNKQLGFYLECNTGLYANKYMLIDGRSAFCKYITGKGKNIKDAQKAAELIVNEFIFLDNEILYRNDVNKISYILSTYKDYLECSNLFPSLVHNTWGGRDTLAIFGDVSPIDINKKNAVDLVVKYYNISKKDTISFGDALIDLPMFELCAYNVAMGNACTELKNQANYTTSDVDDNGIYNAFKYLKLI